MNALNTVLESGGIVVESDILNESFTFYIGKVKAKWENNRLNVLENKTVYNYTSEIYNEYVVEPLLEKLKTLEKR